MKTRNVIITVLITLVVGMGVGGLIVYKLLPGDSEHKMRIEEEIGVIKDLIGLEDDSNNPADKSRIEGEEDGTDGEEDGTDSNSKSKKYSYREITGVHDVTIIKGASLNALGELASRGCEVVPGVTPDLSSVDINTPGEYQAIWVKQDYDGNIKQIPYSKFTVTVVNSAAELEDAYLVADEFMWDYYNHDDDIVTTAKSMIEYTGNGTLDYEFYDEDGNRCDVSDADHEGYFMFRWKSTDGCTADQMVYVYMQPLE